MSRSIRFVLASALLAIPSFAALAQSAQVASSPPAPARDLGVVKLPPASPCCLSKLTPAEAERIARSIETATGFTLEGRMTEARRLLREVIDQQERADAYPAFALRMLANVEFGLDRPLVAAGVLIRLADAAASAGDPSTELNALLDARVLYARNGRVSTARALAPRVRKLLNSPAIPEETRQDVARRFVPE